MTNPYLQKLLALKSKKGAHSEPPKPSKPITMVEDFAAASIRFEGFEGDQSGAFLEFERDESAPSIVPESEKRSQERTVKTAKTPPTGTLKTLKTPTTAYAHPTLTEPMKRGNGRAVSRARPAVKDKTGGLPQSEIEAFARRYEERGGERDGCELDQDKLDAWLRSELAKKVPPERVEIEFERVMEVVFEVLPQELAQKDFEVLARWYADGLRKGKGPTDLDRWLQIKLYDIVALEAVGRETARVKAAAAKLATRS